MGRSYFRFVLKILYFPAWTGRSAFINVQTLKFIRPLHFQMHSKCFQMHINELGLGRIHFAVFFDFMFRI